MAVSVVHERNHVSQLQAVREVFFLNIHTTLRAGYARLAELFQEAARLVLPP